MSTPCFVDDAHFVAGHRAAGRARSDVAGPVADEDVQHLRGADAVEDVEPHTVAPSLQQRLRQRLAGRDAHAQPIARRQLGFGEQHRVKRRYTAEKRRAVLSEDRLHHRRRRPHGREHHGGADRERKRQRVAEPVGEEQFRRGEHHVVGGDAEHVAAVGVRGELEIAVAMDHAFRIAGGAGGVQPERRLVATGCRHRIRVGRIRQRAVKRATRRRSSADEHVEGRRRLENALPRRHQRLGYDEQLRLAVRNDVRIVFRGEQRVQRHRNGAGADCTEETDRKVDAVFEAQQHALPLDESTRPQQIGKPVGAPVDLGIRVRADVVDDRNACGASGREIRQ